MFFITRKRFEEAVYKRVEEFQMREEREREMRRLYENLFKLEERITRLECKGKMDGVAVEVANVEDCCRR